RCIEIMYPAPVLRLEAGLPGGMKHHWLLTRTTLARGRVKADRSGGWCRPRHHHLGAFYLCHSIGCDAYTRPGFLVRSGRTRLDRFDTSTPPPIMGCGDWRGGRNAAPLRSCSPRT